MGENTPSQDKAYNDYEKTVQKRIVYKNQLYQLTTRHGSAAVDSTWFIRMEEGNSTGIFNGR